jgi:hypothetical protein
MVGIYKGNQRTYIDYELGLKTCVNCKETLSLTRFGTNGRWGKHKSTCKDCTAKIVWRRKQEKVASYKPREYWECPNCEHLHHIKFEDCRKCGWKGKIQTLYITERYEEKWN